MRKILVVVCLIGSASACVDLSKPAALEDCSSKGNCVNRVSLDAGDDVPINKPDAPLGVDGEGSDVRSEAGQALDGPPVTLDALADGAKLDGGGVLDARADDASSDTPVKLDVSSPEVPALDGAVDVGVIATCSVAGKPAAAGTVCRKATDLCDVAESCDGVSTTCPADELATAGTACRPVAGDCDVAETCDGIKAACPVDGFKQLGTVCRKAAGPCDVAESCTGSGAACPIDFVAPANTVCRASTDGNKCDPAETCTGSDVGCPGDVYYSPLAAPSNVSVTAGTLQATIAWDPVSGATGYNVKRSTTSGTGFTTLESSPTTNAAPYVDTGLAGSTLYYYRVSSINTIATCESTTDALEESVTPTGTCTPPAVPSITATPSNGIVTLSWPAVTGATSYSVARGLTTGTGYVTIGTVAIGTTFTDSNVRNDTTYYYVVTASNGTCGSGNSNEASIAPACTPPPVPTGLTATAVDGSVTLKWAPSSGASYYSIYKNTTGLSTYTFVNSTSQVTFTDSNVDNSTRYYYVVTASNSLCSSANSTPAVITPACIPPSAPTVTATPSNGQVTLSWGASTGATSYIVYRGTTSGGESATPIATPTTTSYIDTQVTNNTAYYYVVTATASLCSSDNSIEVFATPGCTPPSTPGTLTATPGNAQVSLSWIASSAWGSAGTDTYAIARKTGSTGTYSTIVPALTGTSYTDTGITNGTSYSYKVSANNGSCSSGFNTEVSATPAPGCAQSAPAVVTAAPSGSVQVTLTWTAPSTTPISYGIGRSTNSTTGFVSIGSVEGSILTYTDTDTNLLKNTMYYYEITAVGSTCTNTSGTVSATTACSNPGLPSPSATNSAGAVTIAWTAVSGATGYTVYRSTSSAGTYTAISTNQTAATYTDPASGLVNGTTYYYKVMASNANAQCTSAQSNAVSAMSCASAAVPTGLKATVGTSGQVVLSWTASTDATQYAILRSTTSGGTYASVGTSTTASFTDTGLTDETTYYYVVQAQNGTGNACSSTNSGQIAATPNNCTVFLGSVVNADSIPNTTGSFCFVTCSDIAGLGLSNMEGRTFTINGTSMNCSSSGSCSLTTNPLPAKDHTTYPTNGAYTFKVSACPASGTCRDYATLNWWGTGHDCQ